MKRKFIEKKYKWLSVFYMLNLCSNKEYVNGSKNHISFVQCTEFER